MRQHSFTHNGVTITVHTATGEDELDADVIRIQFGNPSDLNSAIKVGSFARIVTQTDQIDGDLGFTLPSRLASLDELQPAYNALMASTGGLLRKWQAALNEADKAPGDADLTPEAVAAPKKAAK